MREKEDRKEAEEFLAVRCKDAIHCGIRALKRVGKTLGTYRTGLLNCFKHQMINSGAVGLSQFNARGHIVLFAQFEPDAFPFRRRAEFTAAFHHEVGVIVGLTKVSKDHVAQPVMVYGFEQIAGVIV